MEPLRAAARRGKAVSLITNGFGLDYLPDEAFELADFIDVSFDGGPRTYHNYRRGCTRSCCKISRRANLGFRRFRALSVISSGTLENLDDILSVSRLDGIELHMLSPYVVTRNDGSNSVASEPLRRILLCLARSNEFRESQNTVLLLASHEMSLMGEDPDEVVALVDELELGDRVRFLSADPIRLGIIRVTYDGLALAPLDSLHPSEIADLANRFRRLRRCDLFHAPKE